jgi:hypothetical protein
MPDFLVVGAPRSGTTTLYTLLSGHPRIFMPFEKEPTFFARWGKEPLYRYQKAKVGADYIVRDLNDYVRLFLGAKENQIIGEASTLYLYLHQDSIENINKIYGSKLRDIKIIALLRNPAERAWSQYCQKKKLGEEPLEFNEAIDPQTIRQRHEEQMIPSYDYVGMGMYSDHIKAYKENFPQTKILFFEDFIQNPRNTMSQVSEFLEIEDTWKNASIKTYNASGTPKNKVAEIVDKFVFKPNRFKDRFKFILPAKARKGIKLRIPARLFNKEALNEPLRLELMDFYETDIKKLEKILGSDLSQWRKKP